MSKTKILVVEDDIDIANMLRIYFSGQGYDVQVATRGNDALDFTRKQLPHLIVLDIMLPDMDGLSLVKTLKNTPSAAQIPVVVLSASPEVDVSEISLAAGAEEFLTKPVRLQTLQDVINRYTGE